MTKHLSAVVDLLLEYHENLRAILIRQQRGQGMSETREAGNGGKGGKRQGKGDRSNRGQLSEDFKSRGSSSLRTQVSTRFYVKDI